MADTATILSTQAITPTAKPIHCVTLAASRETLIWRYTVKAWYQGRPEMFTVDVLPGCASGTVLRQAIRDRMNNQKWSLGDFKPSPEVVDYSIG